MEPAVFDRYSQSYDADFTETKVGKSQRNRVWKLLSGILPTDKKWNILEVNCGTGADAIWLASLGHRVLATDISSEMVAIGKQKSRFSELNLEFQTVGFQNITSTGEPETFDLIFSNFGGLNCISENDLKIFLRAANRLLKPDGKLVMVVMPSFCLWETLYYLLKFQPTNAFRRLKSRAKANLEGNDLWVYYHNPFRVCRLARDSFDMKKLASVGLFLPPSYLANFFRNKPRLLKILNSMESLFSGFSWFSALSDHYFLLLKKR